MSRVTVTGATSIIGHFLVPLLESHGAKIRAISRNPPINGPITELHESIEWLATDIERSPLYFQPNEILIHAAPIWTLPSLLRNSSPPPKRVIAFSSTSQFTKMNSNSKIERDLAQRLADCEAITIQIASTQGIGWTLFRPTLIYGGGRDKNISQIAAFIMRFGFFPLLGEAAGSRMPVHGMDLAVACIEALKTPQTQGQAYNLPGGEIITYRTMVERIFNALERKPHIVRVPDGVFKLGIKLANLVPRFSELKPEMAERMNADLVFEADKAAADFGYSPREFLPTQEDIWTN